MLARNCCTWNLLGALLIVAVRVPLRYRVVPPDRRDRLLVEPDLRHDGGHAAPYLPRLSLVGWTGPLYYVTALSVGGIVCIAASNGGTTSQDLKTGFLVGATPRYQQIAILIGALASALILGPILLQLNDAATVYVSRVSFEPVTSGPAVAGGAGANLPAYNEEFKPREQGSYRVLNQGEGTAESVGGLQPGEYLVDQSGNVATGSAAISPPTSARTFPALDHGEAARAAG